MVLVQLWLTSKQSSVVKETKYIHENKLRKLELSTLSSGNNVNKVLFNDSNRFLMTSKTKLLLLGLNFDMIF